MYARTQTTLTQAHTYTHTQTSTQCTETYNTHTHTHTTHAHTQHMHTHTQHSHKYKHTHTQTSTQFTETYNTRTHTYTHANMHTCPQCTHMYTELLTDVLVCIRICSVWSHRLPFEFIVLHTLCKHSNICHTSMYVVIPFLAVKILVYSNYGVSFTCTSYSLRGYTTFNNKY